MNELKEPDCLHNRFLHEKKLVFAFHHFCLINGSQVIRKCVENIEHSDCSSQPGHLSSLISLGMPRTKGFCLQIVKTGQTC